VPVVWILKPVLWYLLIDLRRIFESGPARFLWKKLMLCQFVRSDFPNVLKMISFACKPRALIFDLAFVSG
jgi:hypothetical protein